METSNPIGLVIVNGERRLFADKTNSLDSDEFGYTVLNTDKLSETLIDGVNVEELTDGPKVVSTNSAFLA